MVIYGPLVKYDHVDFLLVPASIEPNQPTSFRENNGVNFIVIKLICYK